VHGYVGRGYEGEKVTSVQGRLFTVTLPRTIRIQVVASVACCNATDSEFSPSCPLIFPEMTSVFHSLGQILRGPEGEPRPVRVFS
jgi:hypothetical protein